MRIGILDNSVIDSVSNVILSYPTVESVHVNKNGTVGIQVEDIHALSQKLFDDHGLVLVMDGDDRYSVASVITEGIVEDVVGGAVGAVTAPVKALKSVASKLTGTDVKELQSQAEETEEDPEEASAKAELESKVQKLQGALEKQGLKVNTQDPESMKKLAEVAATLSPSDQ